MILLKLILLGDSYNDGEGFTFHFDSIKTGKSPTQKIGSPTFTFHFDSIKTEEYDLISNSKEEFTFHFDSIKTVKG